MTLEQRVNDDIKQAMLAKQPERLAALRAVKAAILLEKTSGTAHELTDADVVKLMQKLVKQRRGSIPQPDVPSLQQTSLPKRALSRSIFRNSYPPRSWRRRSAISLPRREPYRLPTWGK